MSLPDSLFESTEAIAISYDGLTAPKISAKGEDLSLIHI